MNEPTTARELPWGVELKGIGTERLPLIDQGLSIYGMLPSGPDKDRMLIYISRAWICCTSIVGIIETEQPTQ